MQVKIPATSANLGPGFDCIGLALNLYNYIDFEKTENNNELFIEALGEGKEKLSRNETNLVYRAYKRIFEQIKKPVPGIKLKLTNNIPLARGLGSSSAAVVGGLLVGNKIAGDVLNSEEILRLAIEFEGHPDNVAPALFGGIVICGKDDDKLVYKKMNPPLDLSCCVLVPDYELSTKKAREVLPEKVSLHDAVYNTGRMGFFVYAILTGDLGLLSFGMQDRLHQQYRSTLITGMDEAFIKAKEIGALGAAISGAGPSLLFFHMKKNREALKCLQDILLKHDITSRLFNLEPVTQGAEYY